MGGTSAAAPAIEVRNLTKTFGDRPVVDDLTFSVAAGRVTGFLGPNGAGKTTTLRIVLGLAAATSGGAQVFGRPYDALPDPAAVVGSLLDSSGFHPGRRIRHELGIHAAAAGVDDARVPEVLEEVGLADATDKRVAQLSLGMRQRLGLAAAILGRPRLLVLDEPANGLDPAGMHWLRTLLRAQADDGVAVLVSSHVLAELAQVADDVVVLDRGRLVTQSTVEELLRSGVGRVLVRSPAIDRLRDLVRTEGGDVVETGEGDLVTGLPAERIGELAAAAAIPLHQLRTDDPTLEDVFLELTAGSVAP